MQIDQQQLVSRILVGVTLGCAISAGGVQFAKSSSSANTVSQSCATSISSNLGIEFLQFCLSIWAGVLCAMDARVCDCQVFDKEAHL